MSLRDVVGVPNLICALESYASLWGLCTPLRVNVSKCIKCNTLLTKEMNQTEIYLIKEK